MRRIIPVTIVLLLLTLLQASPLYDGIRTGTVFGVKPDMLLIIIVLLGFEFGSFEAIIYGFLAGFAQDIISSGALGMNALVYLNIGFAAGAIRARITKSLPTVLVFTFTATIVKSILYFVVNSFSFDTSITLDFFRKQLFFETVLNTILAPLFFLLFERIAPLLRSVVRK